LIRTFQRAPKATRGDNHNPIDGPEKMVREMIASADISPAPLRLTLSSDA
jgi:hypothetical protein